MTIDKEAVRRSGMLLQGDSIPDRMVISLRGRSALYKGDLMMLEMIDQCNWQRPIYVALTVGSENYMNLGDNFIQEGLANRITPFTTKSPGMKTIDTEKTFRNVTERYKYGGASTPGIYLDETVMRMCYTHRRLLAQLASALVAEGKNDKAAQVLALADKEIPTSNVPADFSSGSLDIARAYAAIGQKDKALAAVDELWQKSAQYMRWYCSLQGMRFQGSQRECQLHLYILQMLSQLVLDIDEKKGDAYDKQLEGIFRKYQERGGTFAL
jgi:tetratricopeptide (TPR) repeat protein